MAVVKMFMVDCPWLLTYLYSVTHVPGENHIAVWHIFFSSLNVATVWEHD